MFYGTTETIPTWDWVNNMCGCRILYAFDIIPGVIRYDVYGHGFNDPYYYGTEYRTTINIVSPPPGAIRTADRIMIGLSSGGGNCDPNNPPSYDDLCGWYEGRFAGAIWEITPDCEY